MTKNASMLTTFASSGYEGMSVTTATIGKIIKTRLKYVTTNSRSISGTSS